MLFNSFAFIFCFLPVVWAVFTLIIRRGNVRASFGWLVLASLFFYGWWNPVYLLLLTALMLVNYFAARLIVAAGPGTRKSRWWLTLGVGLNLGALCYFKYADFLIGTVNDVAGAQFPLLHVVLPLAISFFTFQKIAFLVDCYRGIAREDSLLNYLLFVGFFPQLIAGPIVHHQEIMPQFLRAGFRGADARMMAMGISLFAMGLCKKAFLADSAAVPANLVYGAAEQGAMLSLMDAWGGAAAYSFQIYFDFSGYSDMAIGLALLFGVRLPDNFLSPYKATGLIDFWRRWHITLSRFLRDYLYFPLGGNRVGKVRQSFNVVVTMLLGGLWHGASWNFILWGLLHGVFIALNHALRFIAERAGVAALFSGWPKMLQLPWRGFCIAVTFMTVTALWVFFRAESMDGAVAMLRGLSAGGGVIGPQLLDDVKNFVMLGVMLGITMILPNSIMVMFGERKTLTTWRPNVIWGLGITGIFLLALLFMQSNLGEEFIYFDF